MNNLTLDDDLLAKSSWKSLNFEIFGEGREGEFFECSREKVEIFGVCDDAWPRARREERKK